MFWERFYNQCLEKGIKPNPFGKTIGISSGVLTKWKDGTIPNGETLFKIAEALDCSVDYLLGRTDNPQSHTGTGVAQDENKLLTCFAALNDEGKEKAIERLEEMAALDKYKKGYQPYVAKEA